MTGNDNTKVQNSTDEATQWANLLMDLFDILIGKGKEVSYNFQNLEIDIPTSAVPQGSNLGNTKLVVNGKVTMIAQSSKTR